MRTAFHPLSLPTNSCISKKLAKFGAKKGAWAVVTGSTDGIGKEFALQLGKAGFNILLVARNVELLNSTAREIGEFHKTMT